MSILPSHIRHPECRKTSLFAEVGYISAKPTTLNTVIALHRVCRDHISESRRYRLIRLHSTSSVAQIACRTHRPEPYEKSRLRSFTIMSIASELPREPKLFWKRMLHTIRTYESKWSLAFIMYVFSNFCPHSNKGVCVFARIIILYLPKTQYQTRYSTNSIPLRQWNLSGSYPPCLLALQWLLQSRWRERMV